MGDVHQLPRAGREVFLDERGVSLRIAWHLDRGLVNVSVWREDRCTDTFQLTVDDVARLVTCLVDGLGAAAAETTSSASPPPPTLRARARSLLRRLAG